MSSTIAGWPDTAAIADGTNSDARFCRPLASRWTMAATSMWRIQTCRAPGNTTIRKLTPVGTNWVSSTIAGLTEGYSDGTNGLARFSEPKGLALDHAGNLYVADSGNRAIRQLTPAGSNWVSSTISGVAGIPGSVDGITSAQLIDESYSFGRFACGYDFGNFVLDLQAAIGSQSIPSDSTMGMTSVPLRVGLLPHR